MSATFATALSTDVLWVLLALITAVVVTAILTVSLNVGLAVAQDALPYLLILSWVILILALLSGAWVLAILAGLLGVYHLALIVPRFVSARIPHWAAHAPKLRLVVSNVFTENKTPDVLAALLIAADGDVMVITEWNPQFAAAFERAGGGDSHPHRLVDDNDHSEYNVCIASKTPLSEKSAIVEVGQLKLTHAVLLCGSREVQIIGIIPNAVVDPGGFDIWKSQIGSLIEHIPSLEKPVVIAGDFNTTRFRPEFRALLKAGLTDAHDALGRSLKPSFRLSTDGVLSKPGVVIRLDHALLSKSIVALDADDLESGGSDHLPFVMTLAVQPERRSSAWFTRRSSPRRAVPTT
ncbi:MAG: endonuclease/exonuclease/phosphatase family protein [Ilumatobacteraceae bacterium]